jgi:tetratricopeptide (TPR) repeat protein
MVERSRTERRHLLDAANEARSRGKKCKAITIYRHILSEDGDDLEIAFQLAELLAAEGEGFEAWNLFRNIGRAHMRARRHDQCLATFQEATRSLPFEFEAWRITAELLLKFGREEQAQLILLEGRRQFRTRFDRAQAIELLRLARKIEPWDHSVVMDLAGLYAQSDQPREALLLLDRLAVHSEGSELRALRWTQLLISHSFRSLRLWLRTFMSQDGSASQRASASVDDASLFARARW